jgi:molecular chaperone DnaK (HSP70)
MIQESFEQAEQDLSARQVREQRVEADAILLAVEKARKHDAYFELADEERAAIDKSINELLLVYNSDDHHLIAAKIEELNQATMKLAENMMNTAVRGALKGTKI